MGLSCLHSSASPACYRQKRFLGGEVSRPKTRENPGLCGFWNSGGSFGCGLIVHPAVRLPLGRKMGMTSREPMPLGNGRSGLLAFQPSFCT